MTLDQLRLIAATIIQDKSPSINLGPEQWSLLMRVSSLKHFKRKLGLPEEYVPGRPLPSQLPEISSRISDDLMIFKIHMGRSGTPKLVVSSSGEAVIPANFFYPLSLMYPVVDHGELKYKKIELLTDKEWVDYLSSDIITPSKEYPMANMQSGHIRFMPLNLQSVEFTYYRKPLDPVYAYTITDGYVVYDAVNSIELEWDEINQMDILHMFLSDIGVVVGRGDIVNVAEKIKQIGI